MYYIILQLKFYHKKGNIYIINKCIQYFKTNIQKRQAFCREYYNTLLKDKREFNRSRDMAFIYVGIYKFYQNFLYIIKLSIKFQQDYFTYSV